MNEREQFAPPSAAGDDPGRERELPDPSRRTVLAGAAWTIPAVLITATASAAAASTTLALSFDQSAYSGQACSTITGAKVTVTSNGVPSAGESVTVSLSGGYTFAGGATTWTGVSAAGGTLAVPAITVPSVPTTQTIVATSGVVSATSSLSGTATSVVGHEARGASVVASYSPLPPDAVAIGGWYFLTPGGDLYAGTKLLASNVSSAVGNITDSHGAYVNYVEGGVATVANAATVIATYGNVPSDATAVGGWFFLSPTGELFAGNTSVATQVSSARGSMTDANSAQANFVQPGGGREIKGTAIIASYNSVPANAVAVGGYYFLTPGGDLYGGNSAFANGVSSAFGNARDSNGASVNFVDDGVAKVATGSTPYASYSSVPANARAVGGWFFLTPAGELYAGNTSLAGNFSSATGSMTDANGAAVNYVQNAAC
ncbi:hypothetical protein [Microbacterium sp. IEGM 1404]|uniref:hypothetical protein n=1 Tax=Microbacterium sp. IEGM 1404 TaxID=3047084 RepID=UPI0024B6A91C|nr:hypothetical protein [Microbacterium sp. IEGM 1404]MDI9891236.1 hypothetical protein [Microbacterium sp. IEGM 1404]